MSPDAGNALTLGNAQFYPPSPRKFERQQAFILDDAYKVGGSTMRKKCEGSKMVWEEPPLSPCHRSLCSLDGVLRAIYGGDACVDVVLLWYFDAEWCVGVECVEER